MASEDLQSVIYEIWWKKWSVACKPSVYIKALEISTREFSSKTVKHLTMNSHKVFEEHAPTVILSDLLCDLKLIISYFLKREFSKYLIQHSSNYNQSLRAYVNCTFEKCSVVGHSCDLTWNCCKILQCLRTIVFEKPCQNDACVIPPKHWSRNLSNL